MSALPPKADIAERDHHVDAVRRKVRRTTAPGQAVSCGRSDEPNWRSRLSPIEEIFFQLAAAHQAPSLFQVRSGCVFERPIGQEWTRSRIEPLLLPLADNASVVQAVSLYDHQSRGHGVFDRKD